jgi:hypothetical protein
MTRRAAHTFRLPILLVWPLLVTTGLSVGAEHVPSHQPAIRLELVIDSIRIHNDADPTGTGEWRIAVLFTGSPGDGRAQQMFRNGNARGGTTWMLNQVVGPLAVFSDGSVRVDVTGVDADGGLFNDDDYLGSVRRTFAESDEWGVGSHTDRSSTGNYSVTYTIRPASLPDLRITRIGPRPGQLLLADTPTSLCVEYRNDGPRRAGEQAIDFLIDGQRVGRETRPFLNQHAVGIDCVEVSVSEGEHDVAVMLDATFDVEESSEVNNRRSVYLSWGVLVPPDD